MASVLEALHAELEGYMRAGRHDRAEQVRAEIARVSADAPGDEADVPDGAAAVPAEPVAEADPGPARRRR